jgi:hypothetical protein
MHAAFHIRTAAHTYVHTEIDRHRGAHTDTGSPDMDMDMDRHTDRAGTDVPSAMRRIRASAAPGRTKSPPSSNTVAIVVRYQPPSGAYFSAKAVARAVRSPRRKSSPLVRRWSSSLATITRTFCGDVI